MRKVVQYQLKSELRQFVYFPSGVEFISFERDWATLWATVLVDINSPMKGMEITCVLEGEKVYDEYGEFIGVATSSESNDWFIFGTWC